MTSNHSSEKAIEKVFATAEKSGCLRLSKKKLKGLPSTIGSFNFIDLLHIDLSNNRFVDFPKHLCSCQFVQDIDCSHNSIRSLPDAFRLLVNLQQLDLSYNSLVQLPPVLSELKSLQILLLNSNKLTELPSDLAGLSQLLHLEACNNSLQTASPQLGNLQRLRILKLRNNRLVTVPNEWSSLKLTCLDLAGNKLQQLPNQYRLLDDTLEELHLELNPLLSPPAAVCARGLRHVIKYLTVESIREAQQQALGHPASWQQQQQQQNGFATPADAANQRRLYVSTSSPPKPTTQTTDHIMGSAATVAPSSSTIGPAPRRTGSGGRGQVQFTSSNTVIERLQMMQITASSSSAPRPGGGGLGVVKSLSFSSALSSHAAGGGGGGGGVSHSPSAYQLMTADHPHQAQPLRRGVGGGAGGRCLEDIDGAESPMGDADSADGGGDDSTTPGGISPRFPGSGRAAPAAAAAAASQATAPASGLDVRAIGQMKAIVERRLSLTLPDTPEALTDALRDGVLLCYLANQIAPGSIPRVHVPPPGTGQLPLPKSRRNIENFLGLCRRIGLPGSQAFLVTDLMSGPRGLQRVAKTVVSLEELANSHAAQSQP